MCVHMSSIPESMCDFCTAGPGFVSVVRRDPSQTTKQSRLSVARGASGQGISFEFDGTGRRLKLEVDIIRNWKIARKWWRLTRSIKDVPIRGDQTLAVRVSLSPMTHLCQETRLDDRGNVLQRTDWVNTAISLRRFGAPSEARIPRFEEQDRELDGIRISTTSTKCVVFVDLFDVDGGVNDALAFEGGGQRRQVLDREFDFIRTEPFTIFDGSVTPLFFRIEVEIRLTMSAKEAGGPEYNEDRERGTVSGGRPESNRRRF